MDLHNTSIFVVMENTPQIYSISGHIIELHYGILEDIKKYVLLF